MFKIYDGGSEWYANYSGEHTGPKYSSFSDNSDSIFSDNSDSSFGDNSDISLVTTVTAVSVTTGSFGH